MDKTSLMMWLLLFLAVLLLAILFRNGRSALLIPAYHSLPPELKARYNTRALGRFTSNLLFGQAGVLLLLLLSSWAGWVWLTLVAAFGALGLLAWGVYYANTNQRFRS